MNQKTASRRTALALFVGAGIGLTPVLLAAQGSAFAAPAGFTGTPLCSQSVEGRNSDAFGWWDRNLCFEYTTTLVGPADSGSGTWEYSVALTPISGDLDFYDESKYDPAEPFTPLTFVLRSTGGLSPTSASSTTGAVSAPNGNDVTVTLTEPLASTITVVGTVPDGSEDVFGFGFAAGDGTTCGTEWSEWVNNSNSASGGSGIGGGGGGIGGGGIGGGGGGIGGGGGGIGGGTQPATLPPLDASSVADELLAPAEDSVSTDGTTAAVEGVAPADVLESATEVVADEHITLAGAVAPSEDLITAAAVLRGTWTLLAGPSTSLCNTAELSTEEIPETPEPETPLPEAPTNPVVNTPVIVPSAAPQMLAQTGSSANSAGLWSILGLGAVAAGIFAFARAHSVRRRS